MKCPFLHRFSSQENRVKIRNLKHHARSGAWVEIAPGSPSQAPRAGRDRDRGSRSSPNCPSDRSDLSENSD